MQRQEFMYVSPCYIHPDERDKYNIIQFGYYHGKGFKQNNSLIFQKYSIRYMIYKEETLNTHN